MVVKKKKKKAFAYSLHTARACIKVAVRAMVAMAVFVPHSQAHGCPVPPAKPTPPRPSPQNHQFTRLMRNQPSNNENPGKAVETNKKNGKTKIETHTLCA